MEAMVCPNADRPAGGRSPRQEGKGELVKRFLQAPGRAWAEYQGCLLRQQRLRARCESLGAVRADRVGRGGGDDCRRDAALAALADEILRGEELRREWEERLRGVEAFLTGLEDDRHRLILRLRYVDGLRWPRVAEEMECMGFYYTERWMHKLHRQALEQAEKLCPDAKRVH